MVSSLSEPKQTAARMNVIAPVLGQGKAWLTLPPARSQIMMARTMDLLPVCAYSCDAWLRKEAFEQHDNDRSEVSACYAGRHALAGRTFQGICCGGEPCWHLAFCTSDQRRLADRYEQDSRNVRFAYFSSPDPGRVSAPSRDGHAAEH